MRPHESRLEIESWLSSYRPRGVDPSAWRGSVRGFVVECVLESECGGIAIAQRYGRVLTRFAVWCVGEGLPLDREVVLSPMVVERYAAVALRGPSAATYRSDLRRLGRALTRRAPWEPTPKVLARRHIASPYDGQELAVLWRAVQSQPTAALRRGAQAIYLLGIGAGLDGRWVQRIQAADVHARSFGLGVTVPEPGEREVPVLGVYAEDLADLVAEAGSGPLVGWTSTNKNAVSAFISRLHHPSGVPRLSAARLRSTWLRVHLDHGTRLPDLVHAAGLAGITVLDGLVRELPVRSADDAGPRMVWPQAA